MDDWKKYRMLKIFEQEGYRFEPDSGRRIRVTYPERVRNLIGLTPSACFYTSSFSAEEAINMVQGFKEGVRLALIHTLNPKVKVKKLLWKKKSFGWVSDTSVARYEIFDRGTEHERYLLYTVLHESNARHMYSNHKTSRLSEVKSIAKQDFEERVRRLLEV